MVKGNIVAEIPIKEANSHQCSATIQQYSLTRDPDDDSTNISRLESEGTRKVEGSSISSDQFLQPLKMKEVHIISPKNLKFSNIIDYWDEEAIANITDLLHEYQNLFPTNFL